MLLRIGDLFRNKPDEFILFGIIRKAGFGDKLPCLLCPEEYQALYLPDLKDLFVAEGSMALIPLSLRVYAELRVSHGKVHRREFIPHLQPFQSASLPDQLLLMLLAHA